MLSMKNGRSLLVGHQAAPNGVGTRLWAEYSRRQDLRPPSILVRCHKSQVVLSVAL